jgi:hypothetical protein
MESPAAAAGEPLRPGDAEDGFSEHQGSLRLTTTGASARGTNTSHSGATLHALGPETDANDADPFVAEYHEEPAYTADHLSAVMRPVMLTMLLARYVNPHQPVLVPPPPLPPSPLSPLPVNVVPG